jgi:Domain of unknown function (DUF4126)
VEAWSWARPSGACSRPSACPAPPGSTPNLPLLVSAVLQRLDLVDLGEPFGALSSNAGLGIIAALFVADFVGDKVPGVDHVLHVIGAVVHPVSGALLFVGQTGLDTEIPAAVAAVLGAVTAETLHGGRAALRPASTTTTAGFGNPLLSLGEDLASLILTVVAFALPIVALLLVFGLVAAVVSGARRLRRRRAEPG